MTEEEHDDGGDENDGKVEILRLLRYASLPHLDYKINISSLSTDYIQSLLLFRNKEKKLETLKKNV